MHRNITKTKPHAQLSKGYPNLLSDFKKDKISKNNKFSRLWILKIWKCPFGDLSNHKWVLKTVISSWKVPKIGTFQKSTNRKWFPMLVSSKDLSNARDTFNKWDIAATVPKRCYFIPKSEVLQRLGTLTSTIKNFTGCQTTF